MISRKDYMKNVYSKYWINARDTIYGFMPYDHSLVDLIKNMCSEHGYDKLLEVAIGTGKPIASALVGNGYSIHGVDISPDLIDECRKNNPSIDCQVGDAENLEFTDNHFDLVYCFHSAWCITDFIKAVSEMIRVVKPGGGVIFDVQNIYNKEINRIYKQHVFENKNPFGMVYKAFKNTVKLVIRRGSQDWRYIISQTPSDPESVLGHLRKRKVKGVQVCVQDNDSLKEAGNISDHYKDYSRLVFVVWK